MLHLLLIFVYTRSTWRLLWYFLSSILTLHDTVTVGCLVAIVCSRSCLNDFDVFDSTWWVRVCLDRRGTSGYVHITLLDGRQWKLDGLELDFGCNLPWWGWLTKSTTEPHNFIGFKVVSSLFGYTFSLFCLLRNVSTSLHVYDLIGFNFLDLRGINWRVVIEGWYWISGHSNIYCQWLLLQQSNYLLRQ